MSTQETIQEIQINKAVKALEASTKQHLVAVSALSDLAAELGARIEIAKAGANKQAVTVNIGK